MFMRIPRVVNEDAFFWMHVPETKKKIEYIFTLPISLAYHLTSMYLNIMQILSKYDSQAEGHIISFFS